MKRLIVFCVLLGILLPLLGCETIKGVGRDITKTGEAIEDATR